MHSYNTGYFMYANPLDGDVGKTTNISLREISTEESKGLCSLKFSYFVHGNKTIL